MQTFEEFKRAKNGKLVLSRLAGLLKGIHFVEDPRSVDAMNSLTQKGFQSVSSFGLPLYPTLALELSLGWKRKSAELAEDIADSFINGVGTLKNGDRKAFCEVISECIHQSLKDPNIFNLNQALEPENLFSLLSTANPMEAINRLVDRLYFDMCNAISDWITVYPIHRVISSSFCIGFDNLSVLDPEDRAAWETIASTYSNARKWYTTDRKNGSQDFNRPNSSWVICEEAGTVDGVRFSSARKIRTFVAIMASILRDSPNVLLRVAPKLGHYSAQFPSMKTASNIGEMHAGIGALFPAVAGALEITTETSLAIRHWYSRRDLLSAEQSKRYTASAQFINYALVADGLEQFIHFFIALDALFGERGKVETKIKDGISRTFPGDTLWEYKISKLFDLRSTIVHGGCSNIQEWDKLERYRRHTKSEPQQDVAEAAMTALTRI
jgi:hypothetical protein